MIAFYLKGTCPINQQLVGLLPEFRLALLSEQMSHTALERFELQEKNLQYLVNAVSLPADW
jgi:hypothetical protein